MTRLLLLLLLWLRRWEAGSSSSSCPLESFQCQEGGRVPGCLGQERQIGCQEDTDGCQQLGSICRNHTCRCGHSSGPCLPFERFCDRRPDCPDGSDEAESLCASLVGPLEEEEEEDCESDEFRCYPGAECYPLSFKCDGHPDCEDGGDEEGCGADLPETPQITPKGTGAPPETLALDPLTIAAIVALLITVVVAAAVTLWASRKAGPPLSRKAALKQLILVEQPGDWPASQRVVEGTWTPRTQTSKSFPSPPSLQSRRSFWDEKQNVFKGKTRKSSCLLKKITFGITRPWMTENLHRHVSGCGFFAPGGLLMNLPINEDTSL